MISYLHMKVECKDYARPAGIGKVAPSVLWVPAKRRTL